MNSTVRNPYPWQHDHWSGLATRLKEGRLPHALLFAGPQGTGKRHLARLLAEALLCDSPRRDGTPCGECRSCHLLATGNHPDFLHVGPEEGKRTIGIEPIRELAVFLTLKSHYGVHKTVVLEPAEALTVNAANALLKTLEEPAEGCYLILCSDQPAALLATIRSRCQKQLFAPVGAAQALPWLEAQLGERRRAELLYAISGGLPLKALELAEEHPLAVREKVFGSLGDLAAGRADPIALAAQWHEQGAGDSLHWLQSALLDVARCAVAGSDGVRNPDQRGLLEWLAGRVDLVSLHHYLEKVQQALMQSKGSVNQQLLLEELLVVWPRTVNTGAGTEGRTHQ